MGCMMACVDGLRANRIEEDIIFPVRWEFKLWGIGKRRDYNVSIGDRRSCIT